MNNLINKWKQDKQEEESSLHKISPYIGKMKPSMARTLITTFTEKGQTVYDPFCGSGTVALESWLSGRNVIATDLSPYAIVLTRSKLYPCLSAEQALFQINHVSKQVKDMLPRIDLRRVPRWVRSFFHPETLREAVAWSELLRSSRLNFLLSCLLGILHHQRPGFLSFPSSHTVPYLRKKKFPPENYPDLYEYRAVRERLERKCLRTLKYIPRLDLGIKRECYKRDAANFATKSRINCIITSPPYMRQLDYGRDNRLRLWFLGEAKWTTLDKSVSPSENEFIQLFRLCLNKWKHMLTPKASIVLVLGDTINKLYGMSLPDVVQHIAIKEIGGYSLAWKITDCIPNNRRTRREYRGSLEETILVLRRNGR